MRFFDNSGEEYVSIFLEHHGVKGMKWGVRKADRLAKKDAKEFTKAKMFFGEGAGTRRKLIKAKVETRSKNINYKKSFEKYLNSTDMGKRSSQARVERTRKDLAAGTARTVRGVKNTLLNTGAPVTVFALGVGLALKNPKVREVIVNAGSTSYRAAAEYAKRFR